MDYLIIFLLCCILFICIIGITIYIFNIINQKNVLEKKIVELQLLKQNNYNTEKNSYNKIILEEKKDEVEPPLQKAVSINIPTRGESEYRRIGMLSSINTDKEKKILPLFGKQTYPRSSKWNYYTSTDSYHSIQLPIVYKNKDCMNEYGCDEIYDDDEIYIPEYEEIFKVSIYNSSSIRYIPVV